MGERTSILVRCSREEAELIRRAARMERRTISGFILNAVLGRLQAHVRALSERQQRKPPQPPSRL